MPSCTLRRARDGLPPLTATGLIKPSLKSPIGNNHLRYSKSFWHAHPRTRHSAPGTICLFARIKKEVSFKRVFFFFLLLVKLHGLQDPPPPATIITALVPFMERKKKINKQTKNDLETRTENKHEGRIKGILWQTLTVSAFR